MEWGSGDFEENAHQHERQRRENQRLVLRHGREPRDLVDLGGSGSAEDQCDAVEQKSGGKGAEEKIFDGGFGAAAGLFAVAGENVGGDRGNLKRNENDEELDGAGEQAHADRAKDDERVKLALVVAVFGQRVEREKQSHEHDAADENVEEDGKGAGFDGAEEAGALRKRKLRKAAVDGQGGSDGGEKSEIAARPLRRKRRVDDHDGRAGEGENHLGEDAVDVGNGVHRWASGDEDSGKAAFVGWSEGKATADPSTRRSGGSLRMTEVRGVAADFSGGGCTPV